MNNQICKDCGHQKSEHPKRNIRMCESCNQELYGWQKSKRIKLVSTTRCKHLYHHQQAECGCEGFK